jgi:hypothetical protein
MVKSKSFLLYPVFPVQQSKHSVLLNNIIKKKLVESAKVGHGSL